VLAVDLKYLVIGESGEAGEAGMGEDGFEFFGAGLEVEEGLAREVSFVSAGDWVIVGVAEEEVREFGEQAVFKLGGVQFAGGKGGGGWEGCCDSRSGGGAGAKN